MSTYLGNQLLSGVATNTISNAHSLFDFKWSDHILNEMSWLRADTYSWHNGDLYKAAYNHLESDILNYQSTGTDIIDGIEIWYVVSPDGHKIIDAGYPDQEHRTLAAEKLYNKTGVSWYYIIDRVNKRFKLPRTKYGFVGLRDSVGKYVPESLPIPPDHTHKVDACVNGTWGGGGSNMARGTVTSSNPTWADSDIYKVGAPVQQRATQMYLYFYVGEYSQSQAEQVATLDVEMFNNKADTNMLNLTDTGKNIANWSNNVTNCITEIPQDIKLELNDGTLTLKAGSKVYMPNGFEADGTTPKFDTVIIPNDIVISSTAGSYTDKWFIFYKRSTNTWQWELISHCFSGSSLPTSGTENRIGYNTSTNKMQFSSSGGSYTDIDLSFPLCIMSSVSGTITSIDQVFNGFGCVGCLRFALPGIKWISPNGRNVDGTLRNDYNVLESVRIENYPSANNGVTQLIHINYISTEGPYYQQSTKPNVSGYAFWYNTAENINYYRTDTIDWTPVRYSTVYGTFNCDGAHITNFVKREVFHSLDYNDKSDIGGWALPSNTYINLTLGSSGSTYTAPANGWVYVRIQATTSASGWGSIWINNTYGGGLDTCRTDASFQGTYPVKKGFTYTINYGSANFITHRFIYAEGEQ